FIKISESYIGHALKLSSQEVEEALKHLDQLQLLIYKPVKDTPQLMFTIPRQDADRLPVDRKRLEERKNLIFSRMNAMIDFTRQTERCRMELVQEYFGEEHTTPCGKCDVCVARRKQENSKEFDDIRKEVLVALTQ